MESAEFWQVIGSLGGRVDRMSAERLADRLANRSSDEITEFADHLADALFALDSPAHADVPIVDPTAGGEPLSMGDDLFLYARCAVVAAGQETWKRVVADPSAMAGTWWAFDGEWLLSVAPHAYEEATGLDWTHESPRSYETGSNEAAWAGALPRDEPEWAALEGDLDLGDEEVDPSWPSPVPHRPWLMLGGAREESLPWVPLYEHLQNAVMIAINADEGWRTWWEASGRRDLELSLWLDPDDEETFHLKKGRNIVRVDAHLDGRFLQSTDRRLLVERASGVLASALKRVGSELGLGEPPAVPPTPPPPAWIDLDEPDTPRSRERQWPSSWPGSRTAWI